jgi:hypothetical protein
MMVVRLECWVRFLVEGRVRLPLDKRLTFGLRRAKTRHLDSPVEATVARSMRQSLSIFKEAPNLRYYRPPRARVRLAQSFRTEAQSNFVLTEF